jgi:hypothetical protein
MQEELARLEREEAAAEANCSVRIKTDEGFYSHIEYVSDTGIFEHVFWAKPTGIDDSLWRFFGLPNYNDPGQHPHYGRIIRFRTGENRNGFGIYLSQDPRNEGTDSHAVILAGSPTKGALDPRIIGKEDFYVRSLYLKSRSGGQYEYCPIDAGYLRDQAPF